jgi:hypothetical protein
MPSFHVGWTVLAVVCLVPVFRHRLVRGALVAFCLLMATTVVVTANHYVIDAVAGIAVGLGGLVLARWLQARHRPEPLVLDLATYPELTALADEPERSSDRRLVGASPT